MPSRLTKRRQIGLAGSIEAEPDCPRNKGSAEGRGDAA